MFIDIRSPGVHWLQDPRSRVYNFTPWLQRIPQVNDFAFERLTGFVKSSRDDVSFGFFLYKILLMCVHIRNSEPSRHAKENSLRALHLHCRACFAISTSYSQNTKRSTILPSVNISKIRYVLNSIRDDVYFDCISPSLHRLLLVSEPLLPY